DEDTPYFTTTVKGPYQLEYTFKKRGFYAVEIINISENNMDVVLSYLRHKGIQRYFQLHSIIMSGMGFGMICMALLINRREAHV
ncbi:MAG: hypothetical protein ACXQTP_06905, partial [Candidatus Methanofastidiosia archaeon]